MTIKILFALFLILSTLQAQNFQKSASLEPVLVQKGEKKHWCPVCGMNLKMFYKTSHTAHIHNHEPRQYCSMRCLAVDTQEHKIDLEDIKVVDAKTQKLVNASSAFYVVGSSVPGTMSKVSKLAFASKQDAIEFAQKRGGQIVDFKAALSMAQKSLQKDIAMVTKKKEKKMYPMGEKIYNKACSKDIDPNTYLAINDLKSAIKNDKLCKPLKEKQLQALSLYLWEVKRFGDLKNASDAIHVTKDEKCPVCGMFVYKYPKWAAQIFYKNRHHSFDGVKDLMKYYFDHNTGIKKVLVTDYYTQKAIDGTKAFYVVGSDIYGPMGHELIPFKSREDAKTFSLDHKGKAIVEFGEITKESVYNLDK
jgi:copper chaperone NosL